MLIASSFGGNDAAADRAYLGRLAGPAADSQAVGQAVGALLNRHGLTQGELDSRLSTLLRRQTRDTAQVSTLSPAPRLRAEHAHALQALQLRVSGLNGLLAGFREAAAAPRSHEANWANVLTAQGDRLITSDVIWRDLFATRTQAQLTRDGANGLRAPPSRFVTHPDQVGPEAIVAILGQLRTPATAAGATVKLGDSGATVSAWQRQLNRWLARQPGHPTLPVTGTFDQATAHATVLLQSAAHIATDGIAGPATHAALTKALNQRSG